MVDVVKNKIFCLFKTKSLYIVDQVSESSCHGLEIHTLQIANLPTSDLLYPIEICFRMHGNTNRVQIKLQLCFHLLWSVWIGSLNEAHNYKLSEFLPVSRPFSQKVENQPRDN